MNPDSNVTDRSDVADNETAAPETPAAASGGSDTLVDTTLIEEISIDGMCGVY